MSNLNLDILEQQLEAALLAHPDDFGSDHTTLRRLADLCDEVADFLDAAYADADYRTKYGPAREAEREWPPEHCRDCGGITFCDCSGVKEPRC